MKYIYLFVILLVFSIGIKADDGGIPSDSALYDAFTNWMLNYDVHFTSGEMPHKFQSWKENAVAVANQNSEIVGGDVLLTYDVSAGAQRTLLDTAPAVSYPNADTLRMSLNELSDLSPSEFYNYYTGHIANPAHAASAIAAATSGGLSAGAIAGIAVGGAAFLGLVVGGGVYGLKKANIIKFGGEKKEEKRSIPSPIEMQTRSSISVPEEVATPFSGEVEPTVTTTPTTPPPPVKGGINVFDHSRNPRHSITARDIRNWDSINLEDEQEEKDIVDSSRSVDLQKSPDSESDKYDDKL